MEKFHTAWNGYNKDEVNRFVNVIVKEFESIRQKDAQKNATIKTLNEQMIRYKNMENTLNRVVIIAEEAGHRIKKIAHDESEMILEDARKNASRIINDALLKSEEAQREADNLRRNIASYKRKLREIVENQLTAINDLDKDWK